MRAIPQLAVQFVADHEGLRTKAYLDSANIPTIGYGHIVGVKLGQSCTKPEALAWLAEDMQIAQRKLYGVLKPDVIDCLTESQWSALLSFAFNVGAAPGWKIWKLINAKRFDEASDQLSRFKNAGGVVVQGLANRRADEFKLWHQDAPEHDLPSTLTRQVGVTPPTSEAGKPVIQSKTLWGGLLTAALGGTDLATKVQSGATTVQGIIAPQAYHSPLLGNLLGGISILIVAAGVAVVVFKLLEQRARTHQ